MILTSAKGTFKVDVEAHPSSGDLKTLFEIIAKTEEVHRELVTHHAPDQQLTSIRCRKLPLSLAR